MSAGAMFSSAITGEGRSGPGLPVSSILSVAGFGGSEGPQRLGGQNLDRFRPLLEGGVGHSWHGGLAPDCPARRSR